MSGYSERSQELARKLGEKAARNLERSGKIVRRSETTGRYTVTSAKGGAAEKKSIKDRP